MQGKSWCLLEFGGFAGDLNPGDAVRLLFMPLKHGQPVEPAESMWIVVDNAGPHEFSGQLENRPRIIPGLKCSDRVTFTLRHVLEVERQQAGRYQPETRH